MGPVLSLITILTISLFVTRVAASILEHTGLSRDTARFQSRSAFSGVGFTTAEAESVTTHPLRRRVVMTLMLIGPIGTASVMAALLLSAFDLRSDGGWTAIAAVLGAGLVLLTVLNRSRMVDSLIRRGVLVALKRFTSVDLKDYARLLHLRDDFGVAHLRVGSTDWFANRTLSDTGLRREGILVLGIECPDGNWIGAPPEDVEIRPGDAVVLYGSSNQIADLSDRPTGEQGDERHRAAAIEAQDRAVIERAAAGR